VYDRLSPLGSQILPPKSADITSPDLAPLESALEGASAVVSLAGVLVGSEKKMVEVQQEGAERVARMAKKVGAGRLVLVSAIGADKGGVTA
jgi:NADH dehydrogenase